MAAVTVRTADGTVGTIIVFDERDDGTVVVLQCREAGGGDITVPSEPRRDEEYEYRLRARNERVAAVAGNLSAEQFQLVIDTSNMPAGPLVFSLGEFVEFAKTAAWHDETVVLDEHTAEKFGLRREHRAGG